MPTGSPAGSAHGWSAAAAQNPAAARPVGTIKSISREYYYFELRYRRRRHHSGQDGTNRSHRARPKRFEGGSTHPIVRRPTGDRILVRGKLADDGKSVLAASVIAMKKADIADKQAHEREEWQKHGLGGLVSGIDAATGQSAFRCRQLARRRQSRSIFLEIPSCAATPPIRSD